MIKSRNRLHIFIAASCFLAYIWLYLQTVTQNFGVCIFKHVTGYPCPSCGTTSGVRSFLAGHYSDAFFQNPLSWVAIVALTVLPLWLTWDTLTSKETLWQMYQKAEEFIKKRPWPFIIIILLIWIWNLTKEI